MVDIAPLLLLDMTMEDIPAVQEVERLSFTAPWPASAFKHELQQNRNARYIVARQGPRIVGYAGLWNAVGEAHITTFAVHPDVRRQGVGKLLLLRLFEIADEIAREMNGGVALTLEVRISNLAAQRLYEGFGFRRAGIRRHYYSDNDEDALIMWTDTVDEPGLRSRIAVIRAALERSP